MGAALDAGYRHLDTAAAYGNEKEVGQALRASGIDRKDVVVETKIWISDYGTEETPRGIEKSRAKLGVDQIDLLLLHQPLPTDFDRTLAAYRALEDALSTGTVRAIGVSNFLPEHLSDLLEHTHVVPAVNQIEVHPYFQQRELEAMNARHGILTQAWSPIGGITSYGGGQRRSFDDPTLHEIATAHGATAAQVMLAWHLQQGRQVIPKSVHVERIQENLDALNLELTAEELARIDSLETGVRSGPEPASLTLAEHGRPIPEA
ncbi:aldo/keto reductase [Brachybacterium sp. P6-10-X1]|uniref:aldo/keto reductase n=1 Tax=Brachybacterium sp. P6-10-X1 TaxID=1903186 RepID=UPI0020A549DF|nr:aldo/keto reductase [Brachybacterium sp. P6-10-X1]